MGSIFDRTARSGVTADDFNLYERDYRNRALSRFRSSHAWARRGGNQDLARNVVAMLLANEANAPLSGYGPSAPIPAAPAMRRPTIPRLLPGETIIPN